MARVLHCVVTMLCTIPTSCLILQKGRQVENLRVALDVINNTRSPVRPAKNPFALETPVPAVTAKLTSTKNSKTGSQKQAVSIAEPPKRSSKPANTTHLAKQKAPNLILVKQDHAAVISWSEMFNFKAKDSPATNTLLIAILAVGVALIIIAGVVFMVKKQNANASRYQNMDESGTGKKDKRKGTAGKRGEGGILRNSDVDKFSSKQQDVSDDENEEITSAVVQGALNEFPNALGPFALHTCKWSEDLKVIKKDGEDSWALEQSAKLWHSCEDLGLFAFSVEKWPIQGRLGPRSSMDKFPGSEWDRKDCVPPNSHAFGWSHPVDFKFQEYSDEALKEVAQSGAADVDFLLRGGFVFYDRAGKICGVRTIGVVASQHPSMWFGAPKAWHPNLTSTIKEKFTRITIQDLKAKGAVHYSWVGADEPVMKHKEAPNVPHGGFCYLFREISSGASSNEPASSQGTRKDIIFPLQKVRPPAPVEKGKEGAGFLSFGFIPELFNQQNSNRNDSEHSDTSSDEVPTTRAPWT